MSVLWNYYSVNNSYRWKLQTAFFTSLDRNVCCDHIKLCSNWTHPSKLEKVFITHWFLFSSSSYLQQINKDCVRIRTQTLRLRDHKTPKAPSSLKALTDHLTLPTSSQCILDGESVGKIGTAPSFYICLKGFFFLAPPSFCEWRNDKNLVNFNLCFISISILLLWWSFCTKEW